MHGLLLSRLHFSQWGIETSFRQLKYTVGLSSFHAYKPEYVKQEIWNRCNSPAAKRTDTYTERTAVPKIENRTFSKTTVFYLPHSIKEDCCLLFYTFFDRCKSVCLPSHKIELYRNLYTPVPVC